MVQYLRLRQKGLQTRLPQALRTEGPGFDANQTSRAFVYVLPGQHSGSPRERRLLGAAPIITDRAIERTQSAASGARLRVGFADERKGKNHKGRNGPLSISQQ